MLNNLKTQSQIEIDVRKVFGVEREGNFPAVLDEWIKGDIVSFDVSKNRQNVLVVTEYKYDGIGEEYRYTLLRFFPVGNKWCASQDVCEGTIGSVLDVLLKKTLV